MPGTQPRRLFAAKVASATSRRAPMSAGPAVRQVVRRDAAQVEINTEPSGGGEVPIGYTVVTWEPSFLTPTTSIGGDWYYASIEAPVWGTAHYGGAVLLTVDASGFIDPDPNYDYLLLTSWTMEHTSAGVIGANRVISRFTLTGSPHWSDNVWVDIPAGASVPNAMCFTDSDWWRGGNLNMRARIGVGATISGETFQFRNIETSVFAFPGGSQLP